MDLPSGPHGPQTHSPASLAQAPIQESLISLSDEDMNRQAVESFRSEWPSWVPMSAVPWT